MIKIDRMEIDDAGADPRKLAKAIIDQLPAGTLKVPVREIAEAIDIYEIREAPLVGIEGALIVPIDKSEGAILVNSSRHETRKRYTIAHEIGHYVHPLHRANSPNGFRCRSSDLSIEQSISQDKHARMEAQANEFAAELLMPARAVVDFIKATGAADLQHILSLAERHEVSREAAARRYIPRLGDPAAIVFSKEGVVRYSRSNEFFPRLTVLRGQPLPSGCVSSLSKAEIGEVSSCIEVDSSLWLDETLGASVFEQTLAQVNGFRMTLLTAEMAEIEDDWEPPRMRHR